VDIVKENDQILIHEHYSKDLIFEYIQTNPTDSSAYREFGEMWEEVKGFG
jgi:hypothetical protein